MKTCQWPIGTPRTDDFTFCGRPSYGKPYCNDHRQVANQPPPSRSELKHWIERTAKADRYR